MWWDLDPVQYELELMTVFNGTKALGQAAKERIRPRLSMRVTEQATTQPWSEYLSDYISEGCGTVVVIFGGLLVAVVLAIHWSAGHATFARLGAAALAMFIWVCGLICFFLRT